MLNTCDAEMHLADTKEVIVMIIKSDKVTASQNLGLIDRALRFAIGTAVLVGGVVFLNEASALLAQSAGITVFILLMASIYPLLTALVGVDPLYSIARIRSCSDSGRNQCGTFPYQIMAMMGKAPKYCESADEHSLASCHDERQENPHHPEWTINQEPMLYPDDTTMDKFAERERKQEKKRKAA